MAAAAVAVRPDEVYPGEGYDAFKEFLLMPSQPREIVVPVAKARPAMHEKASDVSSATSASTATITARSTRQESAKYYGIFEGWGADTGSNADEKPDRPLTYKEKIAAAKSLRANDELITRKSPSFYGVFDGWGPDLDAQPEEAQHSTSNLSKAKSNPTLYYGIFRGSGPSPAGYEEPKVDKPLTYNEKIAAAKSLSANDLNKGTSFYGLFDGWGPEPGATHDDTSKPKEAKSGSFLYYGVFKGSGPSPEDVNKEVKPEKPLTYNQKIAAAKSLKFQETGECMYYGIFKGS